MNVKRIKMFRIVPNPRDPSIAEPLCIKILQDLFHLHLLYTRIDLFHSRSYSRFTNC